MIPKLTKYIDDAASIAASGRWSAMNERIKRLAAKRVPSDEGIPMETVKIYQYEYTDPKLGQHAKAKRLGTKEYIERVGGWIVEGSEIEVDASNVDADGKTEIGFTK